MTPGQRLIYNGYEVCLFPFDWLECTQISGPGQYSHCCGTASDWVGQTGVHDAFYAPFTCTLVYSGSLAQGNTRAYLSDAPVWTPSGLTRVLVAFTHDDTPPTATHFTQGDLIGRTGTAGNTTGDHCHLDQSFNTTYVLINSGQTCGSGSVCWYLDGGFDPTFVYYLSGSETVVDTLGQQFQTWAPAPINKWIYMLKSKRRREAVRNGRIRRTVQL